MINTTSTGLVVRSTSLIANIPWKVSKLESLSSSLFFFPFSISFCSSRKLEFLMFYAMVFFLFGACSIYLQTNLFHSTQSKRHTDAVQMQKIHNFCTQEKEDGLTISLNQAKERTSTEARVPLSG